MTNICFIQDFKYACDACNIHEGAAMRLSKQLEGDSAKAAVMSRVCLSKSISSSHEDAFILTRALLISYSSDTLEMIASQLLTTRFVVCCKAPHLRPSLLMIFGETFGIWIHVQWDGAQGNVCSEYQSIDSKIA